VPEIDDPEVSPSPEWLVEQPVFLVWTAAKDGVCRRGRNRLRVLAEHVGASKGTRDGGTPY
jgi:hypothetical protein